MKTEKNGMNGFQTFASIIYILGFSGSMLFYNESFEIGLSLTISVTILFFFMYALGEIVKQLRILVENSKK